MQCIVRRVFFDALPQQPVVLAVPASLPVERVPGLRVG